MTDAASNTKSPSSGLLWVLLLSGFSTTFFQDRPPECTACRVFPQLVQPQQTSSADGAPDSLSEPQRPATLPSFDRARPAPPDAEPLD